MVAKKILVMPDGNWLAHTSRTFEIAKVLAEMGHEIIFAGDGKYMKLPLEAGFPVRMVKNIGADRLLGSARKGKVDFYNYDLLKECFRADLRLFDAESPDLVLGDFRPSLSTSCKVAEIPLAVTINVNWTNYRRWSFRVIEHSPIGRLGRKILGKQLHTWLSTLFEIDERLLQMKLTMARSPFVRLRRELGLPVFKNFLEALEGDLNLMPDFPGYVPIENLPPNFHFIGPITWEPEMDTPAWLYNLNSDKPVLYFTMGSTGHTRFFQEAIDTFGNSEYQCIMTTAGMVDIQNAPDNFFVTDFAPGSKIMEKSDVVVCHGGNGTVYQAISQGVPIIGIPTHFEQEYHMQRVEHLGIGIALSEFDYKPSHLVEAIETILTEKSYKENVQKYKNILKDFNGPRKGAELIDKHLGRDLQPVT